ncbi:hypothetical protein JCM10213v2_006382 [Rhodosporidiobolus nylandii]
MADITVPPPHALSRPASPSRTRSPSPALPSLSHAQDTPPPRSRTALPPLKSLSLPGSPEGSPSLALPSTFPSQPLPPPPPHPELHHPRPRYPFPSPAAPPPLLAPTHGPVPSADVFAKAYEMLREKWAACDGDIRKVADAASAALAAQRKRRSRSWEDSVMGESREAREEKRAKVEQPGLSSTAVQFFDNPAPVMHDTTRPLHDGVVQRRHHSASPLPPLRSVVPEAPLPLSNPFLPERKRSFSLPPLSAVTRHRSQASALSAPLSRLSPPVPSFPSSGSSPKLSSDRSAAISRRSHRGEALLDVVKSFEAVLACRAEGWRLLAANNGGRTA